MKTKEPPPSRLAERPAHLTTGEVIRKLREGPETPPPPEPQPVTHRTATGYVPPPPAPVPARETAREYTVRLYPSIKALVDNAFADYKRRHPNDNLSRAELYRMAASDVPPGGEELDEWIKRHRAS
jgi:hypothetical protein